MRDRLFTLDNMRGIFRKPDVPKLKQDRDRGVALERIKQSTHWWALAEILSAMYSNAEKQLDNRNLSDVELRAVKVRLETLRKINLEIDDAIRKGAQASDKLETIGAANV